MANTSSLTNTNEMLETLFSESAACEMPTHKKGSRFHGGNGEWYVTMFCNHCTASVVSLVCNPFRNFLIENQDFAGRCGACKSPITVRETLSSMVRRS